MKADIFISLYLFSVRWSLENVVLLGRNHHKTVPKNNSMKMINFDHRVWNCSIKEEG